MIFWSLLSTLDFLWFYRNIDFGSIASFGLIKPLGKEKERTVPFVSHHRRALLDIPKSKNVMG